MLNRLILASVFASMGFFGIASTECSAQTTVLSTSPPNVEYQYQMYFPNYWGWWGPGLSLGGSLPSRGREGISSFYGRPFPVPFGAGVYVNPFAYSARLPGPAAFGLASSSTPAPNGAQSPTSAPIMQAGGTGPMMPISGATPANFMSTPTRSTAPVQPTPPAFDPSRRPIPVSSNTSLQKGREIESIGDEKMKLQQWTQAYINYRNAILIADELAEVHARLGFVCIALNRFPEATLEFKRALFIDPSSVKSSENLTDLLGPDVKIVRAGMTRSVANWARQDLRDQDRLFLLGVTLHYADDTRAPEILEAAYHLTGSGDHLLAMLTPTTSAPPASIENLPDPIPQPPETQKLPELHQQPLALKQIRSNP